MTDDEKEAEAWVTDNMSWDDYECEWVESGVKTFLAGMEHGRKGYIKAEKAIEVVAMNLCRQVNGLTRWEQIRNSDDSLDIEDRENYFLLAKKELGIDEKAT